MVSTSMILNDLEPPPPKKMFQCFWQFSTAMHISEMHIFNHSSFALLNSRSFPYGGFKFAYSFKKHLRTPSRSNVILLQAVQ